MITTTDIDIDFADRNAALKFIPHIPASMIKDDILQKHLVGVYIQNIPQDPVTGYSSIPYEKAEQLGYFKIDFLNLHVYSDIENEEHLIRLLETEPVWELLEDQEIVDQLFHLKGHYDIVNQMKPSSIMQLAMVLAMIRPAKRHLVGKSWDIVEKTIWDQPTDGKYWFKKSHSISYAHVIVVQMNLMVEKALRSEADQ